MWAHQDGEPPRADLPHPAVPRADLPRRRDLRAVTAESGPRSRSRPRSPADALPRRRAGSGRRRVALAACAVLLPVLAAAGVLTRTGGAGVLVTGIGQPVAGPGDSVAGGAATRSGPPRPTSTGSPATGATASTPASSVASATGTGTGSPPAPGSRSVRRTVSAPPAPVGVRAGAQDLLDLAYASRSPAQRLDLYLPARAGTAVPLVVYVHGGAFLEGDKGKDRPQYETLRSHGFAVASLNYRLSGEALFPAGVQDVKAAVRWLRANAPRYGIDPGRFGAWGSSAGGHLVAMLGTTGDQRTLFDDRTLGNPSTSSAVQAVVDWYGPTDFLAMDTHAKAGKCPDPQVHDDADSPESKWLGAAIQTVAAKARTANPVTWVATAKTLPPFLVVHGDSDCNVPHGQSQVLVAALRARHATVTFTLLPGAGHGDPVFDEQQIAPAVAFLEKALRHHA